MRMYDLIVKKRRGEELSEKEIRFMVTGYTQDDIPDYQMAAMLMAVYFQGMSDRETSVLTDAMADSGERIDLSEIQGVKVDKHSTGGVGDKTTLVVAPIAAACGVKVAKMSGRGLGHTGGTVDKLESIPGMRMSLPREHFFETVSRIGLSIIGQSGNLAPADKKLYALRDVTGTVESIPLIASSIMSKKLAAGSDRILLDVKTGSGAFMKTLEDSILLAKKMVAIGEHVGKTTIALITDMDKPLGCAIGNALEVQEAIHILQGQGPEDLKTVCIELAANMLCLANREELEKCREKVLQAIRTGSALTKLACMVEAQGGDPSYIYNPDKFPVSSCCYEVRAKKSGYISKIDAESCGTVSMMLGAGRAKKEDRIDYVAGMVLHKKNGDYVKTGESVATLYADRDEMFEEAEEKLLSAYTIEDRMAKKAPYIYARVTKRGVEYIDRY